MIERILFLPGAGGDAAFWRPVAERLRTPGAQVLLEWPGFGSTPARDDVRSLDDLLALVLKELDRPAALVAQSMGGVLAVRAALERPDVGESLVLAATSGGLDLAPFHPFDWRPDFRAEYPDAPEWFAEDRTDLEPRFGEVRCPVLLLWGDADAISPPVVGEHLAHLLPNASLQVIQGGDHAFAHERPDEVARRIDAHLGPKA